VLSAHFLLIFAGFTSLVFGGYLLDRAAARTGHPGITTIAPMCDEATEEGLLRAAIGAFFFALFAMGGVILTPELRTTTEWPAWLQGAIALSMLSARTAALGGLGILVLYGYGIQEYGVFHLMDYPVFLGIAAYLALTSMNSARLRALRMPILTVSFCISLMWAAIEKWAYPQWTYPVLAERPYLTLGIPAENFMVIAGFVEFAFAFHILTGLGLLRLGIAGLGLIFVSAIADFSRLDAVGHLPVIAVLVLLFLHGPTPLHRSLHDAGRGLLAEARRAGLSFVCAICLLMGAYWGLQHVEHGTGIAQRRSPSRRRRDAAWGDSGAGAAQRCRAGGRWPRRATNGRRARGHHPRCRTLCRSVRRVPRSGAGRADRVAAWRRRPCVTAHRCDAGTADRPRRGRDAGLRRAPERS
jgi:hypothetical protein